MNALQDTLSADTAMGPVTLRVADLDRMIAYYRDAVTLDLLAQTSDSAVLGRGEPAVILQHAPELRHAAPREAGLFHTAILFDTPAALAAAVFSVASHAPGTFTGSADHLVSQAFYFTDPEGNGVELYWDRERSSWSWVHGHVEMATLHLDPQTFLREHLSPEIAESPRVGAARVGHVHLSVGDIDTAKEFYVNRLGFDQTATIGRSALFVSAGGYHHHMAMNTWNSAGAGRRAQTLGLGRVEIALPTSDDIGALAERLDHFGTGYAHDGARLLVEDPWGNAVQVGSAG